MPIFQSKDTSINFDFNTDAGSDAPVLMLSNSLGTTLDMWRPQLEALHRDFRVLRYDTRGHGKSGAPSGPYSLATLGGDVVALLDHLNLERVHFCGLSLGGFITQWLAVHSANRLDSAVICNIGAATASPTFWHDRANLVLRDGMQAVADGVIARFFSPQFAETAPDVVRTIYDGLLHTPPVGYAGACGAIEHADFQRSLPAVRLPTLVIGGKLDLAAPPEAVREVANLIPGARYVEIEAAHISNLENPTAFNAALRDFLTGNSTS